METAYHRIRRYRWVVMTSSPDEGFAIRRRLRDEWGEELLSALGRAFDEANAGEHIIRIPRIELNLRVASESEFATLLPEMIYRQLGQQLRELLNTAPLQGEKVDRWQELTPVQDRFAMVVHYLRHGALPWTHDGSRSTDSSDALRTVSRQQLAELVQTLRGETDPLPWLFRLLQLQRESELPDFVLALMNAMGLTGNIEVERVVASVLRSVRGAITSHLRLRLAAMILSVSIQGRGDSMKSISDRILRQTLSSDESAAFRAILPTLSEAEIASGSGRDVEARSYGSTVSGSGLQAAVDSVGGAGAVTIPEDDAGAPTVIRAHESLEEMQSPEKRDMAVNDIEGTETGNTAADSRPDHQPIIGSDGLPEDVFSPRDERSAASVDTAGFAIRVWNAGVALLHPFIAALFINRGLLATGESELPGTSTARAAALLHFLATGREEIYEYELGLCKVLLGLTPDTPLLVSDGLLGRDDKEEAAALLHAAIGHWSILQSTSVDGLRQSFLQRTGLLRREESGWRLRVEPESFDLLLKYLPWEMSIIKLPWMEQPMHVEWDTP
jgi:hypothetical protein